MSDYRSRPTWGGPGGCAPSFMERKRHRHHGRGPGGFDPRAFGAGSWRGMGPSGGRGRGRARRGDVRAALLLLLEEEPRNGYQLIEEIERRSDGAWRPSPGSVYPALSLLEDEGQVEADEASGRRTFRLTDEGKAHVEEHRERLGSPWDDASGGIPKELIELRDLAGQLGVATMQVAQSGGEKQVAEAKKILADARRSLYRVLADEEEEQD
jgi:DNA-binding PadR family transcriptional regulator